MSDADNRKINAFYEELEANPNVAPGPTALNRRLGSISTNRLGWSKLRAELLKMNGFSKDSETGRWLKDHIMNAGYLCWCGEVHVMRQAWKKAGA